MLYVTHAHASRSRTRREVIGEIFYFDVLLSEKHDFVLLVCVIPTPFAQAHKVFKGTEALGLMQSRAGVTSESLVLLKQALNLVVNEDGNADPYAMGEVNASLCDGLGLRVLAAFSVFGFFPGIVLLLASRAAGLGAQVLTASVCIILHGLSVSGIGLLMFYTRKPNTIYAVVCVRGGNAERYDRRERYLAAATADNTMLPPRHDSSCVSFAIHGVDNPPPPLPYLHSKVFFASWPPRPSPDTPGRMRMRATARAGAMF